jgi:phage terminase large subunit-like protein
MEKAKAILLELKRREKRRKIDTLYPDDGPLRRELYPKHMEFFAAGATHTERAMVAANRVGKSLGIGAYEVTVHMTGQYPDWWIGKRFDGPIDVWCAGDTSKTVRDIIQLELLGPVGEFGTGMIPGDCLIGEPTKKQGIPDAIETFRVKNVTGGISTCGLKSYDQKRKSFQGTTKEVIWLDEEAPMGIYTECLLRTMTVNGHIICTFTPLLGISEVVKSFMEPVKEAGC